MSENLENFYKFAEENMFRHTAQEEFAWNVWNAAIASVVVELPTLIIDEYENGETLEYVEMSELKESLEKAGIRYE